MRNLLILASASFLLLSACGGSGTNLTNGGGNGGGSTPPPPGQVIATAGPPNVEPLSINAGPAALSAQNPPQPALNTAFVTVKVCVPGTQTCQTIDDIEVDTGSSGLRILGSALTLNLPAVMSGGVPLAECLPFADGSSFGPVVTADLTMPTSGETAAGINVQVIGAATYQTLPADCQTQPENTVVTFGANGILGVGPFVQDCGTACVSQVVPSTYYTCPTSATCVGAEAALTQQVSNPVAAFSTDNNGVIVEIAAVSSPGAATVSNPNAVLVFGIGTHANNALGSATVLPADSFAFVRATYSGTSGLNAALDSGSNVSYFSDNTIPACTGSFSGLYCPVSTLNLSATLSGVSGSPATVADFSVVNGVLAPIGTDAAIPGLAGPLNLVNAPPAGSEDIEFDLGMPFFFGRNVFTAIEGASTPGGTGPFFAF